jgi:predicted Zn-dependent protease
VHTALVYGTAIACVAVITACAVNPVTGKRQLTLMSEAQEIQLGATSDPSIVAQYGEVDDAELSAYVANIGGQIARVSHRPNLRFTFRTLDDPVVNAFALPGGYVYMTRGILAYLNSEAAMAGVLGHEVGHVTARHGVNQYTNQQLLGLGLGLGSVLSEGFAQYAQIASVGAQLMLLKFGRDDESQSDELGVEYATRIGYDTHDMAEFFGTLDRLTGDAGRLPEWQSTHPDPGGRFERVNQLTAASQTGDRTFSTNRAEYLAMIDGMVFGPDPRQGFVEGGAFIHPGLDFEFAVPRGWRVANGSTQVQLGPSDGSMAVIFSLDGQSADARAAATEFSRQSGVTVTRSWQVAIAGTSAIRLRSTAESQSGQIGVLSTFIDFDGRVYVFHGLAAVEDFSRAESTLADVADAFDRVGDRSHMSVQPVRLKIVRAPSAGTFQAIASRYPIPARAEIDLAGLAVLNGMTLNERVPAGESLKVLQ